MKERNILPKLKVLLIDNGSDALGDYLTLLNNHKIKTISFQDIETCDFSNYQLIVLSDGHSINVSKNIDELKIIHKTSIPVIGICYGFQLLCHAYGTKLVELPKRRKGLIKIIVETKHLIFQNQNDYIVSEKHRFGVNNLPETLVCLAHSVDGCEIIQVYGKKQFGLQFHPENINPQNEGAKIFNNLIKFIF